MDCICFVCSEGSILSQEHNKNRLIISVENFMRKLIFCIVELVYFTISPGSVVLSVDSTLPG